jgi:hypothetical protein
VAAAASFVPGAAEAHCGHGMYGVQHVGQFQNDDTGCVGKGTPGSGFGCTCTFYSPYPNCLQYVCYYNCYSPC